MDTNAGIYLIVGILAVVLIIGAMKSRAEWIINFMLRDVDLFSQYISWGCCARDGNWL